MRYYRVEVIDMEYGDEFVMKMVKSRSRLEAINKAFSRLKEKNMGKTGFSSFFFMVMRLDENGNLTEVAKKQLRENGAKV